MISPRQIEMKAPWTDARRCLAIVTISVLTVLLVTMALAMHTAQSTERPEQSSSFALAPATTSASTSPGGVGGAVTTPNYLWPWAITSAALTNCSSSCTLFIGELRAPNTLIPISLPGTPGVEGYHAFLLDHQIGAVPSPTGTASNGTPLWSWSIGVQPGNLTGPNVHDLRQLFQWDSQQRCSGGQIDCSSSYATSSTSTDNPTTANGTVCTTDVRCARVGVVPVIQTPPAAMTPGTSVTITNFGCLYLLGYHLDSSGLTVSARTVANCTVP